VKKVKRIAIIGVGLIGGSIGLDARRKRLAAEVVGVGHRRSSIQKALRLKAIDRGTLDPAKGVSGADIVILATPILRMPELARKMAPGLKKGCIVTDVGSTKLMITRKIERALPRGVYFVGGHPMAGSEKRGVDLARRDLFKNSICILTKTLGTNAGALNAVSRLWKALGAEIAVLSPKTHDRIVSEISHLPHMLAFTMMNSVDRPSVSYASGSFRDTTRIASSDARIWRDIAVSNKDEIARSISKFKKHLSSLEGMIKKEKLTALEKIFEQARVKRELL